MASAATRPTVGRALPRANAWGVLVCAALVAGMLFLPAIPANATGFVVSSAGDAGPGSLRQAIIDANATPGADVITFDIGGGGSQVISPLSPLPAVSEQVTIDGLSQPGAGCASWPPTLLIRLDGGSAGPGAAGITVADGVGTTIQGLVIRRFSGDGVQLIAPASGTAVTCNAIGTSADGTSFYGNGGAGVAVLSTGSPVSTSISNSIVMNNSGPGVRIDPGARLVAVRGNRIDGNGGVGIDLVAGASTPGSGASSPGGNDLQAAPALTAATQSGTGTTVTGSLSVPAASVASGWFVVDFFESSSCDTTPAPGGSGEGARPLGSLALGSVVSATGVIDFTASGLDGTSTGNVLTATATDGFGSGNTSTFSSCVTIGDAPATGSADVSVAGSVSPAPAPGGATLTYSFVVHDGGPDAAADVTFTDSLPLGVTLASASSSIGPCTMPVATVVCDLGVVNPGAANDVSVSITVTANDVAGNLALDDRAAVATSTGDPDTSNDSTTVSSTLRPRRVDLSITKAGPASVHVGDVFAYSLGTSNSGPDEARGVTVTDALPAGLAFVSATPTAGVCHQAVGTVTCHLGAVTAGAHVTIDIQVRAAPLPGTDPITLSNTASVSSDRADPTPFDDTSQAVSTKVLPADGADLELTSVLNTPNPVTGGYDLGSTATITNLGTGDATAVVLTETLGPGESFEAAGSDPRCTGSAGIVKCALGSLPKGGVASALIVTRTPKVSVETTIGDTFTVSAPEDSTPANDTTAVSTKVEPRRVDLAAGYVPAVAGQTWISDATVWSHDDPVATMSDVTVAAVAIPGGGPGGPVTIVEGPCAAPFTCMARRASNGTSFPSPAGVFGNLVTITVPQGYGTDDPITAAFLDNWSVAGWGSRPFEMSYLDASTGAFIPQLPWCRGPSPSGPPCLSGMGRIHDWWNPYRNADVWSVVRFTSSATFGRGR